MTERMNGRAVQTFQDTPSDTEGSLRRRASLERKKAGSSKRSRRHAARVDHDPGRGRSRGPFEQILLGTLEGGDTIRSDAANPNFRDFESARYEAGGAGREKAINFHRDFLFSSSLFLLFPFFFFFFFPISFFVFSSFSFFFFFFY